MDQPTSRQGAGRGHPHWALRLLIHALLVAAATLVGLFLGTQSESAADGPSVRALVPKVSTGAEAGKSVLPGAKAAEGGLAAKQSRPAQGDRPAHKPLAKAIKAGVESKGFVAPPTAESPSLPREFASREGVMPVAKAVDEATRETSRGAAAGTASAAKAVIATTDATLNRT